MTPRDAIIAGVRSHHRHELAHTDGELAECILLQLAAAGFEIRVKPRVVMGDLRERIVAALQDGPLSTVEIADALGRRSYGDLNQPLRELERAGLIVELRREVRVRRGSTRPGKVIMWGAAPQPNVLPAEHGEKQ